MKANTNLLRKLQKRDDAVSPVIAVILMVAITVVLAATVYVWVSGFGGGQQKVVNTQLTAVGGDNKITLKHVSGDSLAASGYKVSISLASDTTPNDFCTQSSALSAGGQIVLADETDTCVAGTATDLAAGTYQIKVVEINTNTVLLDREITVT